MPALAHLSFESVAIEAKRERIQRLEPTQAGGLMGDFPPTLNWTPKELHPQGQSELDLNPPSFPNLTGCQRSLGALILKGKDKI